MQDWLLNAFGKAPHVVERILRVFPHDRLDDRIDKDRFTAREVISHLADYEQNVLEAFRIAKTRSGSSRPAYDPDASCATHKYGEKDVYREAEVFAASVVARRRSAISDCPSKVPQERVSNHTAAR